MGPNKNVEPLLVSPNKYRIDVEHLFVFNKCGDQRMAQSLTTKEIESAKAYIIWRSLLKALRKDLEHFKQSDFQLNNVYAHFIERCIAQVEKEYRKYQLKVIRVGRTDQPTVWEVKVGAHYGYVEVNVIEMLFAFEQLCFTHMIS